MNTHLASVLRKSQTMLTALLLGCIMFSATGPISAASASTSTPTPAPVYPVLKAREFYVRIYAESVAFSPNGKYVLIGDAFGTMTLWDAVSGESLRTFSGEGGIVWHVAFSPDGKYVLMASGNTAEVWKTANGDHVSTLRGHTELVFDAAFSPDGKYVVAVSADATAIVWNAFNGQHIRTFNDPVTATNQSGATRGMMSVAFSPDGQSIVTGSGDGAARVWDVSTGAIRQTFNLIAAVRSLAYSPDGKYILTGSFDNTAQLWDVSSGANIRTFGGHLRPLPTKEMPNKR